MAGITLGFLKFVLGLDTIAFKKGMTQAERELVVMQKNFAKVGKGMTNLGKSMSLAVTAPLLALGVIGVKMAANFETAMNSVKISTGATADEMKQMTDLALQIGKDTTKSASQAADAMDTLAKAGMKTSDILAGGAKAAVALSEATGSELDPAAAAITDTMANFHVTAKQLPFVIDQITGAVNESKLDFVDFQLAMGQSGAAAADAGVEFEDYTAALAGISPAFFSGSSAGTSFRTFLQRLTADTKPARQAMEKYGLSFYDAAGNLKPMAQIAEILRVKFKGLDEQSRANIFEKLFGADASAAAIALMNQGAAGIEKIAIAIAKTDAAQQSAERMKGFNAQMEKAGGAFETLAIKVGQAGLLTALTNFVDKISEIVDWLSTLDKDQLNWILTTGLVVGALGPLLFVLGNIVTVLSKIGPAVRLAIAGFAQLELGILALRIAFIGMGRIMLISLGWFGLIIGVIWAVYEAWKNWDTIGPMIAKMMGNIKRIFLGGLQYIHDKAKGWIEGVTGFFKDMYTAVVGNSIVPDMVTEVAAWMAKLEQAMVPPAEKSAAGVKQAMLDMKQASLDLMKELYPLEDALAQYEAKLAKLNAMHKAGEISTDRHADAVQRLYDQYMGVASLSDVASEFDFKPWGEETGVWASLAPATDTVAQVITEGNEKALKQIGDLTKSKTAEMAEAWGQLASDAISSMRYMVDSFKSGDILGGIQEMLDLILQVISSLARIGVFGSGAQASFGGSASGWSYGGARALGGPVVPGKSYMVGENGPEFFSTKKKGFISPSKQEATQQRVVVVPSPYFDVVVDQRAANVAAPMAGKAAIIGVTGSEQRMARRSRRNIYAAA